MTWGGTTIVAELVLKIEPTCARTFWKIAPQPGGPAVTVVLTEPVPAFPEEFRLAPQELRGLLCDQANVGVNDVVDGVAVVVITLAVSPVETFSAVGAMVKLGGTTAMLNEYVR
jgi:hypothetical protein